MWLMLIFWVHAAAAQTPAKPALDYDYFKSKVQPLFTEKRPGHARCSTCHSTGTAFRLQPLPSGRTAYTEEESQKNFQMASRFVAPGNPAGSRLLLMPLAHEAGGTEFHPGGKHWTSRDDAEWKALADWVGTAR
jgi:hypothetical protein